MGGERKGIMAYEPKIKSRPGVVGLRIDIDRDLHAKMKAQAAMMGEPCWKLWEWAAQSWLRGQRLLEP